MEDDTLSWLESVSSNGSDFVVSTDEESTAMNTGREPEEEDLLGWLWESDSSASDCDDKDEGTYSCQRGYFFCP